MIGLTEDLTDLFATAEDLRTLVTLTYEEDDRRNESLELFLPKHP